MNIPEDPIILFSFLNTKLRDEYSSLDSLCEDYGVERKVIEDKLRPFGFEYDENLNKFV